MSQREKLTTQWPQQRRSESHTAAGDDGPGFQLVPVNCGIPAPRKRQYFDQPADRTPATTESSTHAEARESFDDGAS